MTKELKIALTVVIMFVLAMIGLGVSAGYQHTIGGVSSAVVMVSCLLFAVYQIHKELEKRLAGDTGTSV